MPDSKNLLEFVLAAQQALEQVEIAFRGFCGEELSGQDFASGVVLHAESGELRAATFEPVVRGAVELHQFPFASDARAALAMSRRAALSGRADACAPQQAAETLAADGQALNFVEFF